MDTSSSNGGGPGADGAGSEDNNAGGVPGSAPGEVHSAKHHIAARLRRAGEMLRLQGESPYRAGAYESGADALDALTEDLDTLVSEGRLTDIRGIGPSLATTITDLVRTGQSPTLERIMGRLPPGLMELALAHLPGLTLRRIQTLHDQLGVASLEDLREAVASGAVKKLKGFGPQTAAKLSEALGRARTRGIGIAAGQGSGESGGGRGDGRGDEGAEGGGGEEPAARILLVDALEWSDRLLTFLRAVSQVTRAEVAGSVRRWVDTVGDVNIVAASEQAGVVVAALVSHPGVIRVLAQDLRSCRVRLSNGLAVTLQIATPALFAATWLLATGAEGHRKGLQARAQARGLELQDLAAEDEPTIYARLGLPFIPGAARGLRELEAAEAGDDFLDLITERDIRGMVHCHTTFSDGRNTVAQMAQAAQSMGMAYITITDHSPSASYAGGVTPERLPEQWQEIAEAQSQLSIRILRGTESDILCSGDLDYSNVVLQTLDVVIASIHERHRLDATAMTARLVRAMEQPVFKIWGHALGRLLLRREPIACDVERILDAVAASPAAIEINGSPHRLDLPAQWIRSARRRKIKFVISTDAHSTAELRNLRFGVALARRGGLRRGDVLNTLPADEFARAVRPRQDTAALAPPAAADPA